MRVWVYPLCRGVGFRKGSNGRAGGRDPPEATPGALRFVGRLRRERDPRGPRKEWP